MLTQIKGRKNQGSPRMLLFRQPVEAGRVTDLRFDLFLAIAEIVVGNHRDDNPFRIASRQLESRSIVVKFVLRLPTHPVSLLLIRRF